MEDAEFVKAKCVTISTALDCSHNYVCGESLCHINWFPSQVSLEEECLPSFEVLNLAARCLDDENKIPLRFSTAW